MPTSNSSYVWAYLPGESTPVVAGVLAPSSTGRGLAFRYGNSYLARENAVALGPDLELSDTTYPPAIGHDMPASIRDAMPDGWGRQVINRELGRDAEDELTDIQYMLGSGSDRVGAIDFQASPRAYVARTSGGTLKQVGEAATAIDHNEPVGAGLLNAVRNTLTAAGGSQPKAYVTLGGQQWLAKFQTSYDKQSPLIKAERAALFVAERAGLDVPASTLVHFVTARDPNGLALLTERFDRHGHARRMVVSGMTIAEEHVSMGASYPKLVEKLRALSQAPSAAGPELFRRLAFRIAMRIDDDHLRNVAFFWDGSHAAFTPAFDLSPDLIATPTGLTDIGDGSREFSLEALVARHRYYNLTRSGALDIAEHMMDAVLSHRADAADASEMLAHEKQLLLTRTATPDLAGNLGRAQGAHRAR